MRDAPEPKPDHQFLEDLRTAVGAYLAAVDAWEAAYQKYYRLPGYASKIGDDLAAEQRQFEVTRSQLEESLPRARRICFQHNLRDPWGNLIRVSLGQYTPQERAGSAIGRNERLAVTQCMMEMAAACREWGSTASAAGPSPQEPDQNRSLLRKVAGFFF
jgi:hypothetical protein